VSFLDGTTALGSGSLVNGVASLAVSILTAGSHAITAVYNGDSNFAGVSSSALSELVQDFSLSITGGTATGTSQTVSAGGTATYKIDVAPVGGSTFPSTVSFAVTGLPTGATATFSPQTIAAGGGETTVTLTIQVPTQTSMMLQDRPLNRRRGGGLPVIALGCAMLPFAWARRRNLRSGVQRVAGLGILAAMMLVAGCAGNSSSTATTQAKTYTLSMTVSSGTLSYKTALTLIVQ
jgi:Bacterial Ig-like domain (group 3)